MSFLLSLLTLLASAGLPVRVTPVSGSPYEAGLLGVTDAGLQLQTGEEKNTVPLDQLQMVKRQGDAPSGAPRLQVQLRDGSRLSADDVTVADDQVTMKLRRQEALSVPLPQVRWIRFRPATPAVEAQWLGMLDRQAAEDSLVIVRAEDKLDRVGGVVAGVSDGLVAFELDGQPIEAPVDRLEGVLFGGSNQPASAPAIRLTDSYGSVWNVAQLRSGEEESTFSLLLVSGLTHELPIELIDNIELASSVQFLASSEAVSKSYQPHIAAPAEVKLLEQWLGPRAVDDRDLVIRSNSSIEYRIEPGYQRFLATMAIDPAVEKGGKCDVRLLVDGELSWEQTMAVNGEPLGVDLPLPDARRIRLEVADGGDGDVGDVVRFRQPRLIK